MGKFRAFFNKYGKVGLGIYLSVYVSTLFSLFGAIDSGLISAGDAIALLRRIGAGATATLAHAPHSRARARCAHRSHRPAR